MQPDDEIDPVLLALLMSSQAARHIVDLLPAVDLCIELKEITAKQESIITHIVHENVIYESDLSDFIVQCDNIIENIKNIKQKNTFTP